MKSRLVASAALLGTLVATPVFAQEGETPTEVTASVAPTGRHTLVLGAQLELLPFGNVDLRLANNGTHERPDAQLATAIGGLAAVDVTPNLSLGFAPRLIAGIGLDQPGATDSTKELDLRARIAVHGEAWHRVNVYGYVSPGYARLIPKRGDGSNGFTIGTGVGVAYDITPRIFLNAELGYQLAYFSQDVVTNVENTEDGVVLIEDQLHAVFSYAHVALGGGVRF